MASEGNLDLLLRQQYFRNPGYKGVFVDVGAAGPAYLSNSASFRDLGWKVIAIEPNPKFCAEHRRLGHEVLEYACSNENRDDAEFTIVDQGALAFMDGKVTFESFSSLGMPPAYAHLYEASTETNRTLTKISVKVRTLDTILEQHAPDLGFIDIVSVDVEGWELQVIEGLTLDRYMPRVIVLENLADDESYRSFMAARGYALNGKICFNEIYARQYAPSNA